MGTLEEMLYKQLLIQRELVLSLTKEVGLAEGTKKSQLLSDLETEKGYLLEIARGISNRDNLIQSKG